MVILSGSAGINKSELVGRALLTANLTAIDQAPELTSCSIFAMMVSIPLDLRWLHSVSYIN